MLIQKIAGNVLKKSRADSLSRIASGWCNGSTRDFGSLCLGSNPSPEIINAADRPFLRCYRFNRVVILQGW